MSIAKWLLARKKGSGGGGGGDVIKHITGNPLTFSDGADAPLVECKTTISAKQDLHGYSKPWVGGAGKNKLSEIESGGYDANGNKTVNSARLRSADFIPIENNETYIFSCDTSLTLQYNFQIRDENFVTISDGFSNSRSVTNDVGGSYITVVLRKSDNTSISPSDISNPQFEKGSSSTEYEPYSNICPISGMDEVNIDGCGKNLFDKTGFTVETGYINKNTGDYSSNSSYSCVRGIDVSKLRGVTIYSNTTTPGGTNPGNAFYDDNGVFINGSGEKGFPVTVPQNAKYFAFSFPPGDKTIDEIMWSLTNDVEFSPYKPNNYVVDLSGTRYGGELDAVRGVFRGTHGYVDLGDLTWNYASGSHNYFWSSDLASVIKKPETAQIVPNIICSIYGTVSPVYFNGHRTEIHITVDESSGNIKVHDAQYSDATTYTTAMSGVQLAYELATPIEIPLSPTSIRSLLGYNTMWTDGDTLDIYYIKEGYQEFVNTIESTFGSRKGGVKAIDVFQMLEAPQPIIKSDEKSDEEEVEVKEDSLKK